MGRGVRQGYNGTASGAMGGATSRAESAGRSSAWDLWFPLHGNHRRQIYNGVLSICPFERTNQCSLANGLPASRSASQSAARIGGNGPRLAAGTLPTEWRDSW